MTMRPSLWLWTSGVMTGNALWALAVYNWVAVTVWSLTAVALALVSWSPAK